MRIKRRLSDKERLHRSLPKGSKKAVKHPLLITAARALGRDDVLTLRDLSNALSSSSLSVDVPGLQSSVIKLALDSALRFSGYEGYLSSKDRAKLHNTLERHRDKLYNVNWRLWHLWVWDIYNQPTPDNRRTRIRHKPLPRPKHR